MLFLSLLAVSWTSCKIQRKLSPNHFMIIVWLSPVLLYICLTSSCPLALARESWNMRLDSSRNHFMVINISLTLINTSIALAMLLPTILGANIQNGWEEAQHLFYVMAAVSLAREWDGVQSLLGGERDL